MCLQNLTGECVFREGYNENVSGLPCRPEERGISAWLITLSHTDTHAIASVIALSD